MREFQTHDGNVWRADLNLKVAYEVQQAEIEFSELLGKVKPEWAERKLTLIDIEEDDYQEDFLQMLTNTAVLLKLSWFCVRDQARHLTVPDLSQEIAAGAAIPQRPYTEDDYVAAFKTDTVMNVKRVMLEELSDFFPQMATVFSKFVNLLSRSENIVAEKLKEIEPQMQEALDTVVEEQKKRLNGDASSLSSDPNTASSGLGDMSG